MLKVLKSVLREWAEVTTAHGIPNILRAKSKILRFVWLAFFLASTSYCVYQVTISALDFLSFNVVSSYELVYEMPTKFPSVHICNLNPYDGNYVRKEIQKIGRNLTTANDNKFVYLIEKLNFLTDNLKSNLEKKWESDKTNIFYNGFYLTQMLISCKFQKKPCFITNFNMYHNFHYGNCYRFNSGLDYFNENVEIEESKRPGANFGLQLELFVGDPQTQQQFSYLSGVKVLIHNQSYESFAEEEGIDVATGLQTNVAISRTFINHLPLPFNDCIDLVETNIHRNQVLKTIGSRLNKTVYSQSFCLKICAQLFIQKQCDCYDFSLPFVPGNISGCFSQENFDCLEKKYAFLYENFVKECNEKCPMQCSQVVFNKRVSLADYPTDWYANKLLNMSKELGIVLAENNLSKRGFDLSYLKKTILKVNVFYEDLVYSRINESPASTIKNLIAFVGGNLGLFLGVSLLSLIEAVEILFYFVYQILKKKLDSRKNKVYDFKTVQKF